MATITIKKGFTNSIGWNFGTTDKSSHLIEPFTSTPINGTNVNMIKKIMNKILDKFNNLFWSTKEKVINIARPKKIKIKCLIKK